MTAEVDANASSLGFGGAGVPGRRRTTWVVILFGVLFLVNLAPLVVLGLVGGWSKAAWQDPSYPPSFALVCAAPLVALAGFVGARRSWNAVVLSVLGILTVGWPLFVAWVLINALFPPF